jgi:hypothetical protein
MAYDDLLIGGTSLKTIGQITSFDGIFADGPLRGSNVTYPGVAGDTHVPKVRGAYVFQVPMVLVGTWGDINSKLDALRALLDSSSAPLSMTRHRSLTAGTSVQTASGDYLDGLEPGLVGLEAGRVVLSIVNLSGGWT